LLFEEGYMGLVIFHDMLYHPAKGIFVSLPSVGNECIQQLNAVLLVLKVVLNL